MIMQTTVASTRAPTARYPATEHEAGFTDIDIDLLRKYVPVLRHKLSAGQYLYHAGQPFQSLYLINSGFLKTVELADDGRDQVTGFRMRGDFLGAESIGLKTYACGVVSLESGEAWELPYPAMLTACREIPELQARLTAALAQEIRDDHAWMLAIGTLNAEQRVASFLLDVAKRYAQLGYSARHFMLRMRRTDMANFLALKHETVSRVMSRLDDLRLISVERREVHVLDDSGLRAMAGMRA
ncbi:CRP/FNR family transcriptional regulator, anaerobic regulatory protein [Dyella sp. OK004]|uniref:Crp/Fnr family transcriptional regulator n=1 Tax=Dyella sp. OK004 TaxID=1855292 RepID=UPI0008EF689B|nr:cyclic nucleotide-binding domain-containing protein [Dyella sp. OK004]SFS13981.1 CRP/FNR family transcriptional regulator, anaerobic regulatory protein [Dyella sp. OK004]